MKPAGIKKLIVSVNLSQKESYELNDTGLVMYTGSQYSFDGSISAPVLCRVVSVTPGVEDIGSGDWILCNHNTFTNRINGKMLEGDTGEKDGENSIFCISYDSLELKLDKDGNPIPLEKNMIVERVYRPPVSKIIIDPNPKAYETKFRVLSRGSGCEGIENKNIIECYKHSEYRINYYWGRQKKSVLVIRYDDVFGIDESNNPDYENEAIKFKLLEN